jgi:shikimate dehydrogenase
MNEITATTRLTCLLGSPVAHSISPLMHNEAFRLLGLDYAYLAFDIKKEQLADAIKALRTLHAKGFNLTMPLKTAMLEYADELTDAARLSGSVNTVFEKDGKWIGHSTDGIGYMRSVEDAGYSIIGETMTLLGAGGAATSICVQAALDGVRKINIFKRNNATFSKTEEFAARVSRDTDCLVNVYDLADETLLRQSIGESRILVNATNVGMSPDEDASVITDTSMFHPDLIVSDIIYQPRTTKLLSLAKECDLAAFNGLYMLLYQGAAAFECFTGQEMPVKPIKEKFFSL